MRGSHCPGPDSRVVIGVLNPKAGCAGSVLDLFHEKGFNHQVQVDTGILEEECASLLQEFFQDLRKRKSGAAAPV